MTRLLDRLEKKGFIVRTRSDADRRMVKLELTPQGHEAARQLPGLGAAVLNEQLRGFSAADLATLTSLLGRFIANGSTAEQARDAGWSRSGSGRITRSIAAEARQAVTKRRFPSASTFEKYLSGQRDDAACKHIPPNGEIKLPGQAFAD